MKKPLLIVSENEVIAAADAALEDLKKEAKEMVDKLSKEFSVKVEVQWDLIESELKMKGLIPEDYRIDGDLALDIENGVLYTKEKKKTEQLLEMLNEKIKKLMNE